jgi:hypothetical protein
MDTYLFFTIWTSNKNDKRKLPIIRDGSEFDHVYEIIISHLLIDIKLPFRMFNLIFTILDFQSAISLSVNTVVVHIQINRIIRLIQQKKPYLTKRR